jgi:hypothetical protein
MERSEFSRQKEAILPVKEKTVEKIIQRNSIEDPIQ